MQFNRWTPRNPHSAVFWPIHRRAFFASQRLVGEPATVYQSGMFQLPRTAASRIYCNLLQLFSCPGEARRQCGRHSFGITTLGSRSIGLSARARNSRYREGSAPNDGWPVMDWPDRTRSLCLHSWSSRAGHTALRDRDCRQHYGVYRRVGRPLMSFRSYSRSRIGLTA